MTPVVRAGWSRGVIELRQSFTNGADLWAHFFWPVVMLATTFALRDVHFARSGFRLGTLVLPGILGMNASMALVSMSQQLTADREDGTLLRMKATPYGIRAHLVGKIVSVACGVIVDLAIFLVPGVFVVSGLRPDWPTLVWVLGLGLVAALPIGAVLGSLVTSARGQGLLTLPILALIGISGIFYPIAALPAWLRWVAQVFPVYWMGLGTRSGLLPDSAATIELGQSWRHGPTVAVLAAWAVVGLALAPLVLSRVARRESGSALAGRRERYA